MKQLNAFFKATIDVACNPYVFGYALVIGVCTYLLWLVR